MSVGHPAREPVSLEPKEGAVLAGRYVLAETIGEGGMGIVFRANDLIEKRTVAVKLIRQAMLTTDGTLSRFVREAASSAAIPSEHVVRVYDASATTEGLPFIVMEWLEGEDLRQIFRREGRQPIERTVAWMVQAAIALHHAHLRGIIHRDLKLANCFLSSSGDTPILKVLDFGVSKLSRTGEKMTVLTEANVLIGTPSYMAPEQILSSSTADARCDVYSLGVMTYELMAGTLPIELASRKLVDVVRATMSGTRRSLRTFLPDAPVALDEAIARAIRPRVEDRFQSALEFAEALLPFAGQASAGLAEELRKSLAEVSADTEDVDSALRRFRIQMSPAPGTFSHAHQVNENTEQDIHVTFSSQPVTCLTPAPDVIFDATQLATMNVPKTSAALKPKGGPFLGGGRGHARHTNVVMILAILAVLGLSYAVARCASTPM
jgi:serine/threonine protein kinase